ncbi:hypothetical protein [Lachnoclostridium phytofermentans]|uniref:Uncharacterized protein n=1 Tax=Lachnoclostridium phytofermentans (strain ATCC 700394 / DSM 18823 / ISDg) TaxID=357809 RepID=A9KKJ3_LACP7|nr:hypothetical protein [Lachnoclostridium phytofermentans]ABX41164.1 hypothetical protein Cphy_0777 [Lachnoclostridium phytofermentans ISDg]
MGEIKWMQDRVYGLMVHYLSHIMPKEGEKRQSWDEMTATFPIQQFCDAVADSGAGWVIFPLGQNTGYYCSENAVLEQYWPGKCSQRDLMLELAEALSERDIKLIVYLPSEVDAAPEEERKALGWEQDSHDKSVFMERYMGIIRYWSQKFGKLVSGWWFDGCYNAGEKTFTRTHSWDNTRFDYLRWQMAARDGNPDAVIAMCPGAEDMRYVFRDQDYLAGEANTLNHLNEGPLIDGMQWHCLVWLDCFWMHGKEPGEIVPPRFSDQEVTDFALQCQQQKGAITWNVGIYEDGVMAEKTLEQIREVKKNIENSRITG